MASVSSSNVKIPGSIEKLPFTISGISSNWPIQRLFEPYIEYEASLRKLYAQQPNHDLVKNNDANILPLFTSGSAPIKIRARNPRGESKEEESKYIMPLLEAERKKTDSLALVESLREFQHNFQIFSESALLNLDWSNIVAAGSSVVNCLLPVPDGFGNQINKYYHEVFCPASDIDLFLYGLTEDQAIEKIKRIEASIRSSVKDETIAVRTKNTITICSQHPVRHIQIVLRLYKNISEILTGFDIDCCAAAYDGKQVYITPRALRSYITRVNHVDLAMWSPSYENRLCKYRQRGFEIYWSDLDRSRIDPGIYTRNVQETLGLARLLVLELPASCTRETHRNTRSKDENSKSNYHTFTLPYGPKINTQEIKRFCDNMYKCLNADWNEDNKRTINLHRHAAFYGSVEDIINGCYNCPEPESTEEMQVFKKESANYISGRITFVTDNPGRQETGSVGAIEDNWTEMAYISNTPESSSKSLNIRSDGVMRGSNAEANWGFPVRGPIRPQQDGGSFNNSLPSLQQDGGFRPRVWNFGGGGPLLPQQWSGDFPSSGPFPPQQWGGFFSPLPSQQGRSWNSSDDGFQGSWGTVYNNQPRAPNGDWPPTVFGRHWNGQQRS